jgi:hypothetical protein
LREGAGQPGLADAGRTGEQDIEVLPDPLTGSQRLDKGFIQAPGVAIVDVLQGGIVFEFGPVSMIALMEPPVIGLMEPPAQGI